MIKANFLEQRLRVRMRVENPNDRSLPIQGLSYTVYLGGQEFATGVSDASFVVPALGTAEFNMDVNANAAGALFAILSKPHGQGIDYRMKGRVELTHGWLRSIPFEQSGSLRSSLTDWSRALCPALASSPICARLRHGIKER